MKTFGKLITLVLVGAISLVNTSCSKTEEEVVTSAAYYKYDEMKLDCTDGCGTTLIACQVELLDVLQKRNGTAFNESDIISDINTVVSKYNNGVISGTFNLVKSASENGPWSQVKSWTLKYGTN